LQRVAACCSVLQRVAACCSVLQRVAACCSVLMQVVVTLLLKGVKKCCTLSMAHCSIMQHNKTKRIATYTQASIATILARIEGNSLGMPSLGSLPTLPSMV